MLEILDDFFNVSVRLIVLMKCHMKEQSCQMTYCQHNMLLLYIYNLASLSLGQKHFKSDLGTAVHLFYYV